MKLATLDLTPDLFVEFCKVCKSGAARRFIVKKNPLPDDAEIVRIGIAPPSIEPYTLRLYIQSEEFADVSEGAEPELPLVVFETIYGPAMAEDDQVLNAAQIG